MAQTMRAVVFDGPRKISVQDRPVPTIRNPKDVIVKVSYTALCGSELHSYRGIEKTTTGHIMGHEFTGTIHEVGSEVTALKVGDKVVSPFTTSCLNCFYCNNGFSSRCDHSELFGSPGLDGAQAEFVRVPQADGTLVKAPEGIADQALVLMGDIFPTGYFGALNAFKHLTPEQTKEATAVVIGCGPVGLCAVISALSFGPKKVFAVDGVDSRLELAKELGAEPLNFQTDREGMFKKVKEATNGRGADVVIEVVGLSPALRTGFDLLRPFGIISSIGVHNKEIPWTGEEAYDKNIRVQMGRCPVRSIFPEALELIKKKQDQLGFMFQKIMSLEDAVEAYDLFDQMKVQKVIFKI